MLYFCDATCKARLGIESFPPTAPAPDEDRPREGATASEPPTAPAAKPREGARLLATLGLTLLATICASFVRQPTLSAVLGLVTTAGAMLLVLAAARTERRGGHPFDDVAAVIAMGLVAVAALLSPGIGEPPRAGPGLAGATSIAVAVLAGRWLEWIARGRTLAPLRRLARAVEVPARVHRQGEVVEVRAESVRAGEEVTVSEGETVPADGIVRSGTADVVPYPDARGKIRRHEGDAVIAGARVHAGTLVLLATFSGAERNVLRIARIADPSAPRASPLGAVATRLSRAVQLLGAVGAGAVAVGLPAIGRASLPEALAAAAAVLVVASPRALRRTVRAPLLAAAGRSAGHGAFFRDGEAVESAARVAAAVFALRGTLTMGRPVLRDVVVVGDRDADEIVALAAAAEGASPGHPLAQAIRRHAETKALDVPEPRRLAERPGQGVLGAGPKGESIAVGSRRLLLSEGVSVAAADRAAQDVEAARQTAVLVAVSDRVQAVLAMDDALREDAAEAVARLAALSIEPVILTGDSRGTAEALGEALGIEHVRAEVEPGDRAPQVRRFSDAGTVVAVVGHPRRDDAALAAADVSIAMGAAGAPKADASVRLAGDGLVDAVTALADARRAITAARTNVAFAMLVAVGGGILSGMGLLPAPVAAALGALAAAAVEANAPGAG